MTTILSIQSWVATGHVGNAAAIFPLQRLGAEVWAVHTVQFSNHPGHGAFTGQVFDGPAIRTLIDGIAARGVNDIAARGVNDIAARGVNDIAARGVNDIAARGVNDIAARGVNGTPARSLLSRADAVISGYIGDPAIGDAVLHAVASVRAANPAALYCCDPVIGDTATGVFVRPGIPELLATRAVPCADLLTPNQFELEYLAGHACDQIPSVRRAITALQARMASTGPAIVLVTSLRTPATPPGALDLIAADRTSAWLLRVPLLPLSPNGAGDAIAALFLFHHLRTGSPRAALEAAGSAIAGLLRKTLTSGSDELCLVSAQQEFVRPSRWFQAEPL